MFSGSIPALVTPFDADGGFAEDAYRELIDWQIGEGCAGRDHRRSGNPEL